MNLKRLLVVGSGGQMFREYALAAMSRRAALLLLMDQDLTWQKPYVMEYRRADPHDAVSLTKAAVALAPDGALTYDEQLVEPTAELAARLGIPHTDPAAVRRCRDKSELRRCLNEAGIGPVRYAVAANARLAADAAARVGYPVVLKPRALGGSIGVVRADNTQELLSAFTAAALARADDGTVSSHPGVLIEELLDGSEYSLDCVTWEGVTHPLILAEKTVGFPPYFEEIGHIVPAAKRDGLDEAVNMVVAAHCAAGLDRLATHSEFRLTSRGPRIIEINARLGGDMIPLLGYLASGVDAAAAAADVAVGQPPDITGNGSRVAGVRMIYPNTDSLVHSVRLRRNHASYPGLERFDVFVAPGAEVRLPPRHFLSRLAFAVVTADDRSEYEARMRAVEADVVIEGQELIPE